MESFPARCDEVTTCDIHLSPPAKWCEVFVTRLSRPLPTIEIWAAYGESMMTDTWLPVCFFDELEPLWGEAALLQGEQIALFLLPDGSVHAVSNRCPATGSQVMSRGIVGSKGARTTVASPLHKQVYDLTTGECLSAPEYSLRVYPVRVCAGVVQVALS